MQPSGGNYGVNHRVQSARPSDRAEWVRNGLTTNHLCVYNAKDVI